MSEQQQGNRLDLSVPSQNAEISRNPNRLVVGVEDGSINISYVRNHETTMTIRVSGGQVALALPPVNTTSRNFVNANTQQQSSSSAVSAQSSQIVPDNLAVSSHSESYVRCPVCFCPTYSNQPRATICGHVYCGPCLEQCLGIRAKCPICGTAQEYNHSMPLFL